MSFLTKRILKCRNSLRLRAGIIRLGGKPGAGKAEDVLSAPAGLLCIKRLLKNLSKSRGAFFNTRDYCLD
jgi:hypothetical protein